MDQEVKKKPKGRIGKKSLIFIIILTVLLLLILVNGWMYYRQTTERILERQQEAAELEPDTARVMRGNLSNTLDDISGIVRSNQSIYLYWQTAGTVANVYFEIGDTVEKGDILADLDSSTIDSSIIDAEVTQEQAVESMDRLFTSTLSLEQARSKVIECQQSVNDAQNKLNALGVVREDELELGVKYDDYVRAVQMYESAQEYFDSVKELDLDNPDRIRAQQMLESAKSQMDSAKAQYNWYNGEAEEIDVQQAQAALMLAQAQLDDAIRAYDRIKDGPTDNQIRSIQAQIDAAQATINTAKIIAPISGTVAQVEVRPFDVISAEQLMGSQGVLAFRIDDLSSHYIDISVNELEINNITLGQEVSITFDAIPFRTYTGTIVNISNAGTVSNLEVNFALTVRMDSADDKIKSGMMADVAIVTEQAEDVLYVPQQALMIADDGMTRIVKKVMADGSIQEIPVTVGMSSGTYVQITAEKLNEGDEVMLTQVTSSMSSDFSFGDMMGAGSRPGGRSGGGSPPEGGGGGGGRPPEGGGRPR